MLAHPNIKVLLQHGLSRDRDGVIPYRELIYTGPIDEFFDYRFGKLPYRSLEFRHETLRSRAVPAGRHVSTTRTSTPTRGSPSSSTSPGRSTRRPRIVYEYPRAEGDPYYPVPAAGERRALQAATRRSRRRRRRPLRRPAGDLPATTTWTRSSRRRWRCTGGCARRARRCRCGRWRPDSARNRPNPGGPSARIRIDAAVAVLARRRVA